MRTRITPGGVNPYWLGYYYDADDVTSVPSGLCFHLSICHRIRVRVGDRLLRRLRLRLRGINGGFRLTARLCAGVWLHGRRPRRHVGGHLGGDVLEALHHERLRAGITAHVTQTAFVVSKAAHAQLRLRAPCRAASAHRFDRGLRAVGGRARRVALRGGRVASRGLGGRRAAELLSLRLATALEVKVVGDPAPAIRARDELSNRC